MGNDVKLTRFITKFTYLNKTHIEINICLQRQTSGLQFSNYFFNSRSPAEKMFVNKIKKSIALDDMKMFHGKVDFVLFAFAHPFYQYFFINTYVLIKHSLIQVQILTSATPVILCR
jgi:hypothetical protein